MEIILPLLPIGGSIISNSDKHWRINHSTLAGLATSEWDLDVTHRHTALALHREVHVRFGLGLQCE